MLFSGLVRCMSFAPWPRPFALSRSRALALILHHSPSPFLLSSLSLLTHLLRRRPVYLLPGAPLIHGKPLPRGRRLDIT
jgi:hypothetical protein